MSADGARESTKDLERSETSERLLRAAFETFVDAGFERARLQDIAKAAGFTTGAIYSRFENKADLLAAAIELHGASFLELALARLVGGEQIDTMILLGTDSLAGPPNDLHRLLTDVSSIAVQDDQVREVMTGLLGQVSAAFDEAVTGGQAAGTFDPALPADALVAVMLSLMVGSFVVKSLGLPQPSADDARFVVERMVRSFQPDGERSH
jgi:AcrR family transcriptional regulator